MLALAKRPIQQFLVNRSSGDVLPLPMLLSLGSVLCCAIVLRGY